MFRALNIGWTDEKELVRAIFTSSGRDFHANIIFSDCLCTKKSLVKELHDFVNGLDDRMVFCLRDFIQASEQVPWFMLLVAVVSQTETSYTAGVVS